MTGTRLDVLAIGDAVVDVIATAEESFLDEEGLVKGSMQVLDAAGATRLYARMSQARETSGGSAANTMAGVACLALPLGGLLIEYVGYAPLFALSALMALLSLAAGSRIGKPATKLQPARKLAVAEQD